MKVFWRDSELRDQEVALLMELNRAHHASTFRSNCSSVAVQNAAAGSRSFAQAMAAGLMTMGAVHAPVLEACRLLSLPDELAVCKVRDTIAHGERLPGWGNAFVKGGPDPLWASVNHLLMVSWPHRAARLLLITQEFHRHGKMVWPNPAAYTATVAMALGLPWEMASYLFVAGRLDAWAGIVYQTLYPVDSKTSQTAQAAGG